MKNKDDFIKVLSDYRIFSHESGLIELEHNSMKEGENKINLISAITFEILDVSNAHLLDQIILQFRRIVKINMDLLEGNTQENLIESVNMIAKLATYQFPFKIKVNLINTI